MGPYVDIEVEPLSDEAVHHLQAIKYVQLSGDDLMTRIDRTAVLRGKVGADRVPLPEEHVVTRMVLVLHHDGRDIPTMYGVPYTPNFAEFSESLAAVVPLEPNERFLFGWYQLALHPGYVGGFMSSLDAVPRDDHRHYVFTAWRTIASDTYVALHCMMASNLVAPPLIIPPSSLDDASVYTALLPYVPSFDAFQGSTSFHSPWATAHPEYGIHRLTIHLDHNAPGMAAHPKATLYSIHESALARNLMDEWRQTGRQKYYEQCRVEATPDGIRAKLRNAPTNNNAFTVDVIDRTTLRVTAHTMHYQLGLFSGHACPHKERWHIAMEIATHHRDIRGTFKFITDVLRMDDDAPLAPQPPLITVPLQRHQLQTIEKMIECERTTFRALMYTPIPSSDGTILYMDPRNDAIATHHRTVSTNSCGGFASDEMGLGKTLSVIALCVSHPPGPHIGCRATLVVCPPSIIGQWAREIATYAPSLVTRVYHGKKKAEVTMDSIVDADIVLTTYTTYVQHTDFLGPIQWERVVFDESHTMSDRFATRAPHAPRRWCITATPFNEVYRQFRALHLNIRPYDFGVGTMYFALEPIFIRHAKDQTDIALPPLTEEDVPVEFATAAERALYTQAHERAVRELDATPRKLHTTKLNSLTHVLRAICTGGDWSLRALFHGHASSLPGTQRPDSSLVAPHGDEDMCPICMNVYDMPTMTTCNHWYCSDCIATALVRTGAKCPMCRRPQQQSQLRLGVLYGATPFTTEDDVGTAANHDVQCASKHAKLLELLHTIRARDATSKSLVFCHTSTGIPELVRLLKANGLKCRCIHGSMPALQRGNAIRAFQTDPRTTVFVSSIRTAAAGINLTAANHVIFMGPGINRAGHQQAIGRAYRFGQQRPVTVHHMYVKGTIEEGLHASIRNEESWSGDVWDRIVRHGNLH